MAPFITSKSINFSRKIIPQENLSMHLDVSNVRSYSGSGAWKDIKGNRDFVSQGTTTTPLHTTTEGIKSFQFNNSGWWSSNTNTSGVDMGGDCTLLFWFYYDVLAERDTIFEKAGNTYASYQQEIAVTLETPSVSAGGVIPNTFTYYTTFGSPAPNSFNIGHTTPPTPNTWNLMGIKMSDGYTSTTPRTGWHSINGTPWTSNWEPRSNTTVTPAGDIRIGFGYAGVMESGRIGMLTTYNKMLSDKEVLDYYNVTKNKFGMKSLMTYYEETYRNDFNTLPFQPHLIINASSSGLNYADIRRDTKIIIDGTTVLDTITPRSYKITKLRKTNGVWSLISSTGYDVYGNTTAANAALADLQSFNIGEMLILTTHDEPNNRRTTLAPELRENFGSRIYEFQSNWEHRDAHLLISIKGEGVIFEDHKPRYNSDPILFSGYLK